MNVKDLYTTIAGYVMIVLGVIQAIMTIMAQWFSTLGERKPTITDWFILVGLLFSGITALFTGRNPDGSKKTTAQVSKLIAESKVK